LIDDAKLNEAVAWYEKLVRKLGVSEYSTRALEAFWGRVLELIDDAKLSEAADGYKRLARIPTEPFRPNIIGRHVSFWLEPTAD
jgi:hypothetical protein